ncbi:MAG: aminotransferase class V-fold PLP-dependent enzyme [Cytophagales bacterium]|nr:aminotransferase class V-fold PLP-dependent enzyme [Cytophagales bacterium]
MKKVFFTPGPSEIFFTYNDHMRVALRQQIGSISHRSKDFESIFEHTTSQVSEVLQLPPTYRIVFAAGATEIWERTAQNLILETSHHFVHGAFGKKFHQVAQNWGKDAQLVNIENEFIPQETNADLIALTMNETSTGFQHHADNLEAMRKLNPNALISLDVVSAVPGMKVNFDKVDSAFLSVQKCFGMPAGLGVWILNDRVLNVAEKVGNKSYHSIPSLIKFADKNQTPSTPNVLGIYLLGKIAEDMNRRGLQAIQSEINYKAALLYQTLENHSKFSIAISEKKHQSKTTIVADCDDGNTRILDYLSKQGMILGDGYGDKKDQQIRIANFPVHSKEQVELLCDSLEKFR